VGAWIETGFVGRCAKGFKSRPAWARGLKLDNLGIIVSAGDVAPCVGAWIETKDIFTPAQWSNVAPCVGAWIETAKNGSTQNWELSRALRGRVD